MHAPRQRSVLIHRFGMIFSVALVAILPLAAALAVLEAI